MKINRTAVGTILAGLLMVISIGMSVSSISAQQLHSYAMDPRIWKGEVHVIRKGSANYKKTLALGWKQFNRQAHDQATIHACGEAGYLYVTRVERSFSETSMETHKLRSRSKKCPPEGKEKKTNTSTDYKKQVVMGLHKEDNCWPLESISTVQLMVFPGERYTLLATAGGYATKTINEIEKTQFICTGETKVTEFHQVTCSLWESAQTSITETGEGDNIHRTMSSRMPPFKCPIGVIFQGYVSDNLIEDSCVVREEKASFEGDYAEKTTARWSFVAIDPCDQVIRQLMNDLAYAEAYSSESIQDFAGSMEEYKALVNEYAYKRLFGKTLPRDMEPSTNVSMCVDPKTCKLHKEDEHREQLKGGYAPNIIFDATLKHEKTHVSQCETFYKEFNMDDPHIHGSMEVTAHLAGIADYIRWLEINCPNYDTAGAKKRAEELKAKKFKP